MWHKGFLHEPTFVDCEGVQMRVEYSSLPEPVWVKDLRRLDSDLDAFTWVPWDEGGGGSDGPWQTWFVKKYRGDDNLAAQGFEIRIYDRVTDTWETPVFMDAALWHLLANVFNDLLNRNTKAGSIVRHEERRHRERTGLAAEGMCEDPEVENDWWKREVRHKQMRDAARGNAQVMKGVDHVGVKLEEAGQTAAGEEGPSAGGNRLTEGGEI